MTHRAFVSSADLAATIPAHAGVRMDRLDAAIHALGQEARRLDRLGLTHARIECRRQLRYWEFLRALFSLEGSPRAERGTR